MPRRGPLIAIAVAIAAVIAVVLAVVAAHNNGRSSSGTGMAPHNSTGVASDIGQQIPVEGAVLSAEVITPAKPAGTTAPLIVMPASWGNASTEYRVIGTSMAQSGYQVVEYAQRGMGGSTGQIDLGGQVTQHDVSTVISWALQHLHVDAQRIGTFGISYGAGTSLLAAAQDPRIKAVVALSTWTNFADSFDADGTPHTAALNTLVGPSKLSSHFDTTLQKLQQTLTASPAKVGTIVQSMSSVRSVMNDITQLNANHPAIMIANAFEDSVLGSAPLIPFYDALTTAKKLEMGAGDHGGPERPALYGGASPVVTDGRAWLDHYLRGVANGIDTQPPIVLRDVNTGVAHTFASWPTAAQHLALAAPAGTSGTTSWSATITSGTDTSADAEQIQVVRAFHPASAAVSRISSRNAFVWTEPAVASATTLNGSPAVTFGLSSSSSTATVFVYLYDVAPNGLGQLVSHQAYTATTLTPGLATPVSIAMQPVSWTVPTGDHLAVVVDTVDPRYTSLTPSDATITVSSSGAQPAMLTIPAAA